MEAAEREEKAGMAGEERRAAGEEKGSGGGVVVDSQELPAEVRQRLEVVQRLLGAQGGGNYGEVQRECARSLGLSVSSVQRLMRRWKEEGVAGLYRRVRQDRGVISTSREWQAFIVETYRAGNRGSGRMSRAQVYVRVKVRAQELECEGYPGRTTVYRILQPLIEPAAPPKRTIGWRGSRLSLTTRDGQEIAIEWSNQVWQCDHTKVDVLVAIP